MRTATKRALWLAVLAIAAVGAFAAFRANRKPEVQYFTAKVERGDVRQIVEATGTINAVTTVQVGSQVSGAIAQLMADFNSQVRKGQLIAQIDPSIFEGNLLQAKADLENARANLAAARANLERAKATAVQMRAEYQRTAELAKQGIMSQQQLDVAKANFDSADASVAATQAQVTQAQAQVTQRTAAVQVAQTNLNHTRITAPIDGTVVARNVDVGQTVAASLQAPTLFTIAQDLTKMQVYAKTDESDVGLMKAGLPVTFKVDAFPRETFRGQVVQVRMNATAVQNVVTYDTVIEFANPERKLFPGMTAYVSIPVATADDVLKVPNGALRFRPEMTPEELRATYEQHGIKMPGTRRGGQSGGDSAPMSASAAAPGGSASAAQRGPQGQGGQRGQGQFGGGQGRRQRAGAEGQPGGGEAQGAQQQTAPPAPREARADMGVVWKLGPEKQVIPVQVRLGITDYTQTAVQQVLAGDLKEGDTIVTGNAARRTTGQGPSGFGGQGRPGGGPR